LERRRRCRRRWWGNGGRECEEEGMGENGAGQSRTLLNILPPGFPVRGFPVCAVAEGKSTWSMGARPMVGPCRERRASVGLTRRSCTRMT
jgi:hypothetical protein